MWVILYPALQNHNAENNSSIMVISFLKHTNFYSFHYNYFLYWIDAAKILIYIWFKSLIRFIFYFQRSFKRLPVVFKSFWNRLIVGNRMFGGIDKHWCLNCCNENIKIEQQKIAKVLQIENWVLDLLGRHKICLHPLLIGGTSSTG